MVPKLINMMSLTKKIYQLKNIIQFNYIRDMERNINFLKTIKTTNNQALKELRDLSKHNSLLIRQKKTENNENELKALTIHLQIETIKNLEQIQNFYLKTSNQLINDQRKDRKYITEKIKLIINANYK